MVRFRSLPIKQKLVILIMLTTTMSMGLAGMGIVWADSILFRSDLRRNLSALARIIADNSTAALAFNDPASATGTLAALRARPHIAGACLYRVDGTVLAKYSRQGDFRCPPVDLQNALRFTAEDLFVSQSVQVGKDRLGTFMLQYDLGEIGERATVYGSTVLGILFLSTLLAVLLSTRLQSIITMPIASLVRATTSVAESGDYRVRAEKHSDDELGVLVDRFNTMLAGIESRDNDLLGALLDREAGMREARQQRERFEFMAESMPQKIFTAKSNGDADYHNRQWVEFTGLSFDQIRDWGWKQFIHPDDLDANVQVWREAINSGSPFHFEHRFRRADGAYRWHLSRAEAMRDKAGNISLWIGSSTEIHEQIEREAELRRANDDLQQFAYAASHDLQEPIRNVAVYSEVIARRYGDLLDQEGKQFLGFLTEGARRLGTLVTDLLAYTRAGIVDGPDVPVDSTAVVENTLASLAEAIRECGAIVTQDALPEVLMGKAHLQQLFQNLIGNAIKYRGNEPPRVHVSAEIRGGDWCFSVKDNGIGIDPKYNEKIFGVFKRLHNDKQFDGTGIGLAICQRVVERYGGRIWVESEPGRGSTFYFTIRRGPQRDRGAAV